MTACGSLEAIGAADSPLAWLLRVQHNRFIDACRRLGRSPLVSSEETVRRIQIAAGLWVPRKLRPVQIQQPRLRRACLGELIQIDGCEHRWFEERAPACTALVYVDDTTSRLMVVHFTGAESTFVYFEATREYLGRCHLYQVPHERSPRPRGRRPSAMIPSAQADICTWPEADISIFSPYSATSHNVYYVNSRRDIVRRGWFACQRHDQTPRRPSHSGRLRAPFWHLQANRSSLGSGRHPARNHRACTPREAP